MGFRYPIAVTSAYDSVRARVEEMGDEGVQRAFDDLIRVLAERDRALEDFLTGPEVLFSMPDAVILDTSGRYYFNRSGSIASVYISLQTAGTSTTTVDLYLNGTLLQSFSLTSGQNAVETKALVYWLQVGDYVHVESTAAGTGALGLTVQVRTA